jgi:hypothetical protein
MMATSRLATAPAEFVELNLVVRKPLRGISIY